MSTYDEIRKAERRNTTNLRPTPTLAKLDDLRADDVPWPAIASRFGYSVKGIQGLYLQLKKDAGRR